MIVVWTCSLLNLLSWINCIREDYVWEREDGAGMPAVSGYCFACVPFCLLIYANCSAVNVYAWVYGIDIYLFPCLLMLIIFLQIMINVLCICDNLLILCICMSKYVQPKVCSYSMQFIYSYIAAYVMTKSLLISICLYSSRLTINVLVYFVSRFTRA